MMWGQRHTKQHQPNHFRCVPVRPDVSHLSSSRTANDHGGALSVVIVLAYHRGEMSFFSGQTENPKTTSQSDRTKASRVCFTNPTAVIRTMASRECHEQMEPQGKQNWREKQNLSDRTTTSRERHNQGITVRMAQRVRSSRKRDGEQQLVAESLAQ